MSGDDGSPAGSGLQDEKALLELARTKGDALTELSDRLGGLEWARRRHNIERGQLEDLYRQLEDVVYFPLQAVFPYGDGHACRVKHGLGTELRLLDIADYNNRFVAVRAGVEPGEHVSLDPPEKNGATDPIAPPVAETPPATDELTSAPQTLPHAQEL